jgi:hypothetical protein
MVTGLRDQFVEERCVREDLMLSYFHSPVGCCMPVVNESIQMKGRQLKTDFPLLLTLMQTLLQCNANFTPMGRYWRSLPECR